jgi:hypothetical protein
MWRRNASVRGCGFFVLGEPAPRPLGSPNCILWRDDLFEYNANKLDGSDRNTKLRFWPKTRGADDVVNG